MLYLALFVAAVGALAALLRTMFQLMVRLPTMVRRGLGGLAFALDLVTLILLMTWNLQPTTGQCIVLAVCFVVGLGTLHAEIRLRLEHL